MIEESWGCTDTTLTSGLGIHGGGLDTGYCRGGEGSIFLFFSEGSRNTKHFFFVKQVITSLAGLGIHGGGLDTGYCRGGEGSIFLFFSEGSRNTKHFFFVKQVITSLEQEIAKEKNNSNCLCGV